jgi:hypothetical protein
MYATFRSWKLPDGYDAPQNGTTKTYSTDGTVFIGTQIRNRNSYFACALENWLFAGTVTPRFKHDDANLKGFRTPNSRFSLRTHRPTGIRSQAFVVLPSDVIACQRDRMIHSITSRTNAARLHLQERSQ